MRFPRLFGIASGILLFVALAALMACGWRLRGALTIPDAMAVTHVTSSVATSELVRNIKRELRAGGVEIVDEPQEGAAVLHVYPRAGRRVLSVGNDGKAREYEVYYTVSFNVQKPGSDFRVESQQITLTRDFVFDPLEALAVGQEQALLEQSMERDLARMVVQRLSSAGRSVKSGPSSESDSQGAPLEEEATSNREHSSGTRQAADDQ